MLLMIKQFTYYSDGYSLAGTITVYKQKLVASILYTLEASYTDLDEWTKIMEGRIWRTLHGLTNGTYPCRSYKDQVGSFLSSSPGKDKER